MTERDSRIAERTSAHRLALGASMRELRRRRGMTLRDLSSALAVSPGTLSAIENGLSGTSSERLIQLADVLHVRVDLLLNGIAEPITDARWASAKPGDPQDQQERTNTWRTYEPDILDPALRGALASFLEFGYHGSTMRGIAERAELSVAGLYHYYASKQQMLVTILDRTMADLSSRSTAALADARNPAERFANLVECLALHHTHRREFGFIGVSEMRSLADQTRQRIAAVRNEEQHKVDVEVVRGCRQGVFGTRQPHEAARAVVTMCTSLSQWFRIDGPASPEDVAAQYVDFALDLVRCEPSARPLRGKLDLSARPCT